MKGTGMSEENGGPAADILIVDDTLANLRLLATMLSEHNYKVRAVPDGPMALTAATSSPPDLILLDINMPEMDGFEVCRRLRKDPSTSDIPIIFISALDDVRDKVRAFTEGGVDYITKPVQLEEVLARVNSQLSLRGLQRQLHQANEELESRIERRTAQLRATNDSLQREVLERQEAEQQVRSTLKEREVLLQEVYHRVKNNGSSVEFVGELWLG